MKYLVLLFWMSFSSIICYAQKAGIDSSFFKTFDKGVIYFSKNSFDSAIYYFKESIKIGDRKNLVANENYSSAINNIGMCYKELKNPTEAHNYMYKSLLHARLHKHLVQENNALLALNNLHWLITKNNWQFSYTPVVATYSGYTYFPVASSKAYNTDSVMVVIYAGSNDGINDSSYVCSIFKRYDTAYKQYKDMTEYRSIAKGYIQKIEPNRTTIIAKRRSDLPIEEYDQAYIFCQSPVELKKSYFNDIFNHAIALSDYTKTDQLISRRFLYYYNDEKVNFEFIKILKQELLEIEYALASDTLATDNILSTKATAGLFVNQNVIMAMHNSSTKHVKNFIQFVAAYPGKYFGNKFSFAEVYATWLLNNTPLEPNDVLSSIILEPSNTRAMLTGGLMKQIDENKIIEKWISQGLDYFDKDDLLNVRGILMGLSNVYKNNKDVNVAAWYNFFTGMNHYKTDALAEADTMFTKALLAFDKINNKEGTALCKQALHKMRSNNKVLLQVQAGQPPASYKVVMHPNGKYYATCGFDRNIRIFNLELGKEVRLISDHTDEVTDLSFSSNGRYLASCSRDKTIKIWNTFDYSLISTIPTKSIEYCLKFSPNNKLLASGGADSLIKLWDVQTNAQLYNLRKHNGAVLQLCFVEKNEDRLYSCGNDSMIYEWDLTTKEDIHWYKKKARLLNMKVNADGSYLYYTANDTTINVWNLLKSKFYFSQKISFEKYGTTNNFGEPDFSPDGSLLIYPNTSNRINIVDLGSGYMKTVTNKSSVYQYLNSLHFSPNQKNILATYPYNGKVQVFDFSSYKSIASFEPNFVDAKTYKGYSNPVMMVQFSNDGKSLYAITERLMKFDLTNGTTTPLFYSPQGVYNEQIMLNDSIAIQTKDLDKVVLYHQYKREQLVQLSLTNSDTIVSFKPYISANKFCIAGKHGLVQVFHFTNNIFDTTPIVSLKLPLKPKEEISFCKIDSFKNRLLVSSTNARVFSIELDKGKLTGTYTLQPFGDLAITPKYIYINSHDGTITKVDASTFKLLKKIKINSVKDGASFIRTTKDFKNIVALINDREVAIIHAVTETVRYTKKVSDSYAFVLTISPDDKYFVTGGFDSKMTFYDIETGLQCFNIFTPSSLDFVLADTLGNYMASKRSLEGLSFKYNDKLYGFDQFDIKYNRPDIALQQTGKGDNALIEAYKKAFEKRIKKAGFNNEKELHNTQLPFVALNDMTSVEMFTTLDSTDITVECFDAKHPIKSFHVLVNNNPIYGLAGKNLNSTSLDTVLNIKIPLANGKNSINLYCTNAMGQTSLSQSFEVRCTKKITKQYKKWFVGIGVSNYKDSSMNLRYAAKDIRDLTQTFTKGGNKNIAVDTLIDKQATLENIQALKQKLLTANINDTIILAVTGHGLLNKNLDFYYGTYDVDFNNPEARGLKYEALENMLDGVLAQYKLLLIDACHSGALDKESLLASKTTTFENTTNTDSGTVNATRSTISTIKVKESQISLNNTFELMQNLFADFNNSSGTVVISAAGGLEYAFESPQWNNGVFTYCVRKALENDEADTGDTGNYDFNTSVQELMKYVSFKVSQLTQGRQKPTSRRESLAFDWFLK